MTKEAKIITVFNQKGGAGKTHTSCNLAGTFGHRGYDVLIVDMDGQKTSETWTSTAGGKNFPGTCWPGFRFGGEVTPKLHEFSTKYDLIIIDCAPALDQPGTWASLLVSDLGIIPTKLGFADLAALPATLELAKQAQKTANRHFPVRKLAVAFQKGKKDQKDALEALRANNDYPAFPLFGTTLGDRVAFTRPMGYGATPHAMPGGGEAVQEIEALADEVSKLLGLPKQKKGSKS